MNTMAPAPTRTTLSPRGYLLLRSIHLLVAAVWVGSAFATLTMVAFVMDAQTILGTYRAASTIDLFIWRPCTFTMLATGILYSVFTHWRFIQHRWIMVKYVINLVPIALGYAILSRPMATMTDQVQALGAAAWESTAFQQARSLFLIEQSLALVLLVGAVILATYKPRLGQSAPLPGTQLRVSRVVRETADAVSVFLTVPRRARAQFNFEAGQFLTVITTLNGAEQRRSYSMSTSPLDHELSITVRRVKGGLVSNWLNDHLAAGDRLRVLPPTGRFAHPLDLATPRSYYLYCGGCGISPIMSVLKTVLATQSDSPITLIYANRNPALTIFRTQLDELVLAKPQLQVIYLYDHLEPGQEHLGTLGFISYEPIAAALAARPPINDDAAHLICGPVPFMDLVVNALRRLGVPESQVHTEVYDSTATTDSTTATDACATVSGPVDIEATSGGEHLSARSDRDTPLLTALLAAGFQPPYSCRAGNCSTCVARVTRGSATMKTNHVLSESEIDAGLILTCQALPTSSSVSLDYDHTT